MPEYHLAPALPPSPPEKKRPGRKKGKKPMKYRAHTAVQIDAAMEASRDKDGNPNREKAGQMLGLTAEQVKQRIYYNKFLRLKWQVYSKVAAAVIPITPAEQLAQNASVVLQELSQRILQQIRDIEDDLSDEATKTENKPALRTQLFDLMSRLQKQAETAIRASWNIAKIQAAVRHQGPSKNTGVTDQKPKVGFRPRAHLPTVVPTPVAASVSDHADSECGA